MPRQARTADGQRSVGLVSDPRQECSTGSQSPLSRAYARLPLRNEGASAKRHCCTDLFRWWIAYILCMGDQASLIHEPLARLRRPPSPAHCEAWGQRIPEAGYKPFLFLSPDAIPGREEDSSIFLIDITLPRSASGIIVAAGNRAGATEGVGSAWKERIQAQSGHRHRFAPLG